MAGILDNKTRIMDVIITEDGKRQITSGQLKIEYASFTDGHTFYKGDIASGSDDASNRLFFEAISLPRDKITFESDDSGNLLSFNGGDFEVSSDGTLYQGTDNRRLEPVVSSSIFSSLVDTVMSSSIDNFRNLQIIGSKTLVDYSSFKTDVDFIDFTISNSSPFGTLSAGVIDSTHIDSIDPLFLDYRLSLANNFTFLPPIISSDKSITGSPENFGVYEDINQRRVSSWDELLEKVWPGYPDPDSEPQSTTIKITNGSKSNNLMCQFFEFESAGETGLPSSSKLKKLDVIDFGIFTLEDGSKKHAFFAGKIFIDDVGQPTFINLFTLVFEKQETD